MDHFGPKNGPSHNPGLALKVFFLKFAQRMGLIVHGSYINGLSKKNSCLKQMGNIRLRMSHPASQLCMCICCKNCSTIFHNERGQEGHGIYMNGFSERSLIQSNLIIL